MAEDDPTGAARLVPLDPPPFELRMGVRRLDEERWIDPDDRLAADVALKSGLLAAERWRYVVDDGAPATGAAAAELEHLVGSWWDRHGGAPTPAQDDPQPLVRAALRTQEDWCLLAGDDARLVAGCVCFPTRWVLTEKLGLPLVAVHEPVAGYREALGAPVDRFLARLEAGRVVWRANWNLVDDASLSQPYVPAAGRRAATGPDDVADLVWFRVERQTLRRLPTSGAVAFGIRVHQRPVRELDAEASARLLAAVEALPAATFAYKGLAAFWDQLGPWLAERVRTA